MRCTSCDDWCLRRLCSGGAGGWRAAARPDAGARVGFHGRNDVIVPAAISERLITAMHRAGASPDQARLTSHDEAPTPPGWPLVGRASRRRSLRARTGAWCADRLARSFVSASRRIAGRRYHDGVGLVDVGRLRRIVITTTTVPRSLGSAPPANTKI